MEEVIGLQNQCKRLPDWEAYKDLGQMVDDFPELLVVLEVEDRHWKDIMGIAGHHWRLAQGPSSRGGGKIHRPRGWLSAAVCCLWWWSSGSGGIPKPPNTETSSDGCCPHDPSIDLQTTTGEGQGHTLRVSREQCIPPLPPMSPPLGLIWPSVGG